MTTPRKGRPTKRTPQLERALLKSIGDGLPLTFAAALAGISYETFCGWRRQFPEFSDTINGAIARGVAHRLALLRKAMDSGDVNAAKWWLEHVLPEYFAKNRIEVMHQAPPDEPKKLMSDEAMLAALQAVLRKRLPPLTPSSGEASPSP